jgi:DEAD/DEAH box helicase domain-containing protein
VAIATGTASGKSLAYQIASLEALLGDGAARALYIFPTKALAHDQLRSVREYVLPGINAMAYDGDTPPDDRTWARRNARLIVTNPDMLHFGILPYHSQWSGFLAGLRFVVLDEMHTLRGVWGGHVALILRRLRRLAARYGASPVFCCASATVGDPAGLAERIVGVPFEVVDDDRSPHAERVFALWNPPLMTDDGARRRSSHSETASLLARLVDANRPTIAFTRSRRGAEVVASTARSLVADERASQVAAYRGGYLAEERRALEHALTTGELVGVAATNALELGIDIGGLDACILDTFPGTVASMRQQAGRAGRRGSESLAVLVAGEDALDQWYMAHPKELFTRPPEPSVVNPENPFLLEAHLGCAAYEQPLVPADCLLFGDSTDDVASELVARGDLRPRAGRLYWARRHRPAHRVTLRWAGEPFSIVEREEGRLVGTEDGGRVFTNLHPGAVYLHRGDSYVVVDLDIDRNTAWVEPFGGDWYTMAKEDLDLTIVAEDAHRAVGDVGMSLGAVRVTSQVVAYQKRRIGSRELIGTEVLDLPRQDLLTRAFWYVIPEDVLRRAAIDPSRVPGTVHAAEHAGIAMLPLFFICDRWDLGGVSIAYHPQTGDATIFIYDAHAGGAGNAELGYGQGSGHMRATLEAITACPCEAGCPSCVQSPKCGNWNDPLDKDGAAAMLRVILAGAGDHDGPGGPAGAAPAAGA